MFLQNNVSTQAQIFMEEGIHPMISVPVSSPVTLFQPPRYYYRSVLLYDATEIKCMTLENYRRILSWTYAPT
jgi:hypothetical protein